MQKELAKKPEVKVKIEKTEIEKPKIDSKKQLQ